jgi:hypothetical protein
MNSRKKLATKTKKTRALAGVALLGLSGRREAGGARAIELAASSGAERQSTMQTKFYCNSKALSPAERTHHKQLTDKLMGIEKGVVETENGYEFQYPPAEVSISELADWVTAEGKCCPFFDFHIDLEREGKLLCLRLTGPEGVKAFIRSEFQIAAK